MERSAVIGSANSGGYKCSLISVRPVPLSCLLSVRVGQTPNHHIKLSGVFNRKLCKQLHYSWKYYMKDKNFA